MALEGDVFALKEMPVRSLTWRFQLLEADRDILWMAVTSKNRMRPKVDEVLHGKKTRSEGF